MCLGHVLDVLCIVQSFQCTFKVQSHKLNRLHGSANYKNIKISIEMTAYPCTPSPSMIKRLLHVTTLKMEPPNKDGLSSTSQYMHVSNAWWQNLQIQKNYIQIYTPRFHWTMRTWSLKSSGNYNKRCLGRGWQILYSMFQLVLPMMETTAA